MGKPIASTAMTALALAAALTAAASLSGRAALPNANPEDSLRGFYDTLLGTMKQGRTLGHSGRYARIEPVVNRLFDIPFMARLATGPAWAGLNPGQQQQIAAAFGRYISATYADRFDSYSGERLEVAGQQPSAAGIIVQTRIVKSSGEPVSIDYLMHQGGAGWTIADVYLDGSISQLATERSEFDAIVRRQGVDGLIATLNRKVDFLTRDVAQGS